MVEVSAVRANEAPYCNLHGMALSTGALISDAAGENARSGASRSTKRHAPVGTTKYSDAMEFQIVQDPNANLSNWFFTDIEKILVEATALNPHGPKDMMLPWEGFVNVGQNPKVGSSIKKTQHTQLCNTSLQDYPVFQLSTAPKFSDKLKGTVDLIEVEVQGAAPNIQGLFLKVLTASPTYPPLIEFLVNLRIRLLEQLGGAERVDFFVMCMSDNDGGFVVVFAVLPQLEKVGDEKPDWAEWRNPLTGESTQDTGLQEARIDFGKGVGHFLVMKPAFKAQALESGESTVRRIWAFNRVPESRKLFDEFIAEKAIFGA